MRNSDLADYLDHDPFLELRSSVQRASRAAQHSEPRPKDPRKADVKSDLKPATPVTPEKSKRSETFEREKFKSDVLKIVMDVFEGARWTTREEYRRLAENRDRRGRKKRG
jgi:hypothetical protein